MPAPGPPLLRLQGMILLLYHNIETLGHICHFVGGSTIKRAGCAGGAMAMATDMGRHQPTDRVVQPGRPTRSAAIETMPENQPNLTLFQSAVDDISVCKATG